MVPSEPDHGHPAAGAGRDPRSRAVVAALALFLLAYVSRQALRWVALDAAIAGDAAIILVALAAILTARRAAARCALVARLRTAWRLVAAALSVFLAGALAALAGRLVSPGPQPCPSVADVLLLACYPILLAGVLCFPSPKPLRSRAMELTLDLAIVALGSTTAFIYALLGPGVAVPAGDGLRMVVAIGSPIGDSVLIVAVSTALLHGGPPGSRRSLVLMLAALLALTSGELARGYASMHGGSLSVAWTDVPAVDGMALFALAALAQRSPDPEGAAAPVAPEAGPGLLWLPYGAVGLGFATLALTDRNRPPFPDQAVMLAAIALVGMVSLRQFLVRRRLLAVQWELRQARDELAALARTDALTGLPNHRALVDEIDRELARAERGNTPFGLLFLDLDKFKALNDTHGHQAGDEALRELGQVLRGCLREIDTVGRWGGEEFVVVLPDCGPDDAVVTAERLRMTIAHHRFESPYHRLTCSVGVCGYPHDAGDRAGLLSLADTAMYAAKRWGRNCTVAVGDPERKPATPLIERRRQPAPGFARERVLDAELVEHADDDTADIVASAVRALKRA